MSEEKRKRWRKAEGFPIGFAVLAIVIALAGIAIAIDNLNSPPSANQNANVPTTALTNGVFVFAGAPCERTTTVNQTVIYIRTTANMTYYVSAYFTNIETINAIPTIFGFGQNATTETVVQASTSSKC